MHAPDTHTDMHTHTYNTRKKPKLFWNINSVWKKKKKGHREVTLVLIWLKKKPKWIKLSSMINHALQLNWTLQDQRVPRLGKWAWHLLSAPWCHVGTLSGRFSTQGKRQGKVSLVTFRTWNRKILWDTNNLGSERRRCALWRVPGTKAAACGGCEVPDSVILIYGK